MAFVLHATANHSTVTVARQNNSRLEELSSKVSALRGVTVDIYDNARNHEIIDSSVGLSRPSMTISRGQYSLRLEHR